jgi:hypothetical protein
MNPAILGAVMRGPSDAIDIDGPGGETIENIEIELNERGVLRSFKATMVACKVHIIADF